MPDLVSLEDPRPDPHPARLRLEADADDADPVGSAMELRLQEVAYRATVAAMSDVLQPSLADFLR